MQTYSKVPIEGQEISKQTSHNKRTKRTQDNISLGEVTARQFCFDLTLMIGTAGTYFEICRVKKGNVGSLFFLCLR